MERESSCFLENGAEFEKVCASVRSGYSLLVLGEVGTGINDFAHVLYKELLGEFSTAIAIYKGSLKNFFKAIAFQLDIPTENEEGKQLTVDLLKEEIAGNCSEETLLILPEAKRLTTSIRYWLEDLMAMGVTLVCLAAANPGKDIFLEMSEVELELPSDGQIREVMEDEAKKAGLNLTNSQLAALQPLAGRNQMLARKVIRNEKHGLNKMPEHTQYVVIMPVIIAALFAFAVVRFIGMGTGNKGLYITGGVALVSAMALKQLGGVRGARKRLGG